LTLPITLALPTSKEDIKALEEGTFYNIVNNPSNIEKLRLNRINSNFNQFEAELKESPVMVMKGLFAAMAKTSIKHSIKEIELISCGMSTEKVREMMDKHGFTNVRKISTTYDETWE
jgi:hypothetical protein